VTEFGQPKNGVSLQSSLPATLESILCTEELLRRPSRAPDYEKENRALVKLVHALADSPSTILQRLAETILDITQCDSAGLSLLTKDGKTPDVCGKRFYWPAIAGTWNSHVGGGTPRDFGPCGDVLDQNRTLLFRHFERRYHYMLQVMPAAEECLLVPFYVAGKGVGTIWAITHTDRHKFDAEDDRVMASLAKFASSAYQAVQSIDDLTFQVAERENAEKELRELTDGLERQVRARTEELERRNIQLSEARAGLAKEKLYRERAEAYLAEAQRLSHTGSWHWNIGTGEIFWSKEFFAIFGYDPETTKPSNQLFFERIHPADRSRVEEARSVAVREERDYEAEYRLLLPGHIIKYVHSLGHCTVGQSGEVEFTGAIKDVTEGMRAEETVRRSEKELRDVIEAIPTCAWTAQPDGSVEFVNRHWREYTGLSREGSFGSGWQSAVHPEDMDRHVGMWRESVSTGDSFENEVRYRRSDGKYRWFLVRAVPLRDEQRNILKWYGISTDIDDRKRAEDALRRSEAFLAEAQRLSHTGSWRWDVSAGKVVSSKECFGIFGVDPEIEEGSYTSFMERVHPEDRRKVEETVSAAVNQKKDWELECRLLLPGGVIKHIHCISHCRVSESAGVEYIGTAMDVTELRRGEEERERLRQVLADLAHVNRVTTMGQLTASLAHEIKQPIAAALTNAEICLDWLARARPDIPDIAEAQEAASRLIRDVTRASNIISRIGSLYKKSLPEWEWINLNELIREMIALLQKEAARYSISLHEDLANGLPKIMADRVGLQQVLMNLMLNGIEAMKDMGAPGKLTISSHPNGDDQLLVSVADMGIGLRPENVEQIFSAFFTSKSQGTGMGLPISRSIIESHGGRLWATANRGPGATFQFVLPVKVTAHSVIQPAPSRT
jgi:PAS domain S-box-containing protein